MQPSSTPDPLVLAALAQYGATMLQVQTFELSLAALVLAAELRPDRHGKSLEREVSKMFSSTWHLAQNASASEMKNRLKGKISDELTTEISALIGWRNFLAHRYLRMRFFRGGPKELSASGEVVAELLRLGQAFADGSNRVGAESTRILGSREGDSSERAGLIRGALE